MELRDKNGLTEAEFLAGYRQKDYPRPSLTADVLVFNKSGDKVSLMLIRRGGHPYLGKFALPGGFVNPGETVEQAATRELAEETGTGGLPMKLVGVYSAPGRDPRAWVVSCAYGVCTDCPLHPKAGDDASDVTLFELDYSIKDGICTLKLMNGEQVLSAKVEYGEGGMPSKVLESDGLAFDHGQIIADGIRAILER
ncbi:MAG: NUDIX domain-containing protein [Eubacteriales bacterium]